LQSRNQKIDKNEVLKFGTPRFLKKVNGRLFSLLSGGAANNNYAHWLWDCISKFFLIKKFYKIKKSDFFYLPSIKYNFQIETLKFIGVQKKQLIDASKLKHIQAKKIICTSHVSNFAPEKIPSWNLFYLRKLFLSKIKKKKIFNSKFFIDRGEFKNINYNNIYKSKNLRILLNENEIKKFLLDKSFSFINLNNLNFYEQINLFYYAKVIVGLYGAGLANLVFCRKNTKVIEILTKEASNEYLRISKFIKLKHIQIRLKTKFKSDIIQNGLMYLKINRLNKVLKNFIK